MIYGKSINVIYSLIYAKKLGKTFTVYVASQSDNDNSEKIIEIFKRNGVD